MTYFDSESLREHGRVLTGKCKHFCPDWDFMTLDETCGAFDSCTCFPMDIPVQATEDKS